MTQPGWDDVADYFCEGDMKYGMVELKVPTVVKPQTDTTEGTQSPTIFEEPMETLHIIPGKLYMPRGTFETGSNQRRLGFHKPLSYQLIASLSPNAVPVSSPHNKSKPVAPFSIYPCILRP